MSANARIPVFVVDPKIEERLRRKREKQRVYDRKRRETANNPVASKPKISPTVDKPKADMDVLADAPVSSNTALAVKSIARSRRGSTASLGGRPSSSVRGAGSAKRSSFSDATVVRFDRAFSIDESGVSTINAISDCMPTPPELVAASKGSVPKLATNSIHSSLTSDSWHAPSSSISNQQGMQHSPTTSSTSSPSLSPGSHDSQPLFPSSHALRLAQDSLAAAKLNPQDSAVANGQSLTGLAGSLPPSLSAALSDSIPDVMQGTVPGSAQATAQGTTNISSRLSRTSSDHSTLSILSSRTDSSSNSSSNSGINIKVVSGTDPNIAAPGLSSSLTSSASSTGPYFQSLRSHSYPTITSRRSSAIPNSATSVSFPKRSFVTPISGRPHRRSQPHTVRFDDSHLHMLAADLGIDQIDVSDSAVGSDNNLDAGQYPTIWDSGRSYEQGSLTGRSPWIVPDAPYEPIYDSAPHPIIDPVLPEPITEETYGYESAHESVYDSVYESFYESAYEDSPPSEAQSHKHSQHQHHNRQHYRHQQEQQQQQLLVQEDQKQMFRS